MRGGGGGGGGGGGVQAAARARVYARLHLSSNLLDLLLMCVLGGASGSRCSSCFRAGCGRRLWFGPPPPAHGWGVVMV